MNTLVLAGFIVGATALAYVLVYPQVVRSSFTRLVVADLVLTGCVLAVVGMRFWGTGEAFSFGLFEANWFVATMLIFFAVETPFVSRYCKKHGINLLD